MRRYGSSGGRTIWLSGITEVRGIAQHMIMKRLEPAIGFAAWAKRRISIWGVEGGGRLWVEIGGAPL
jgi:hypothetical protein